MEEMYCLLFKTTLYTQLRSFQFKINHNILYTNEKLHKIGKSQTSLCENCNKEIETLTHLFVNCEKISHFWKQVLEIIKPYGIKQLDEKYIILGVPADEHKNNIVNHIILEAKYYIYVCKLEKAIPNFKHFKNRLKITENTHRFKN